MCLVAEIGTRGQEKSVFSCILPISSEKHIKSRAFIGYKRFFFIILLIVICKLYFRMFSRDLCKLIGVALYNGPQPK